MKPLVACARIASARSGAVALARADQRGGDHRHPATGVWGRIDIGNLPVSELVCARPVITRPTAVVVQRAPISLRVRIESARAAMTKPGTAAAAADSALEQLAHGVHHQAHEADGRSEKGNPSTA